MLRSTKKLTINKGKFGSETIILYAETNKKTFILNPTTSEESLLISCQTFYFADVTNEKIIDEVIEFYLSQDEVDVYFEKFSSEKIKFREIFNNMIDYLVKDLIVERYAGYISAGDLEVFDVAQLGK